MANKKPVSKTNEPDGYGPGMKTGKGKAAKPAPVKKTTIKKTGRGR